jgi:hypothetical protein
VDKQRPLHGIGKSVLFTTAGHSMQTNNSVKETAEIDFTGIEQLKECLRQCRHFFFRPFIL